MKILIGIVFIIAGIIAGVLLPPYIGIGAVGINFGLGLIGGCFIGMALTEFILKRI